MNKRLWLVLMALVVALAASSCRHSSDDDSADNTPAPQPTPTKEKVLKEIKVISKKDDFNIGDVFKSDGLIVKAIFDDNTEVTRTDKEGFGKDGWKVDATKFKSDAINSTGQDITVSYTHKDVTKSATYKVFVRDPKKILDMVVSGNTGTTNALNFAIGQGWDPTGLSVVITFDDSKPVDGKWVTGSRTLTYDSKTQFENGEWTFTGFNDSAANPALPMTVTYAPVGDTNSDHTATKDITVGIYDTDGATAIRVVSTSNLLFALNASDLDWNPAGLEVEMDIDDGLNGPVTPSPSYTSFNDPKWEFGFNSDPTLTNTLTDSADPSWATAWGALDFATRTTSAGDVPLIVKYTPTTNPPVYASFTVTIYDPDMFDDITIGNDPTNTTYLVDTSGATVLDLTGLRVDVSLVDALNNPVDTKNVYWDDIEKALAENEANWDSNTNAYTAGYQQIWEVTGFDATRVEANQTVIITHYTSDGSMSKTATFTVNIEDEMTGITILPNSNSVKGPTKLKYLLGELLDYSGMQVQVNWKSEEPNPNGAVTPKVTPNGDIRDYNGTSGFTGDWEVTIADPTALARKTESVDVTVSFFEGTNRVGSDTFQISVYDVVLNSMVTPLSFTLPENKTYFDGEDVDIFFNNFRTASNEVTVTFDNGSGSNDLTLDLPLNDPRITVSLKEDDDGYDVSTQKFVVPSGKSATVTVNIDLVLDSTHEKGTTTLTIMKIEPPTTTMTKATGSIDMISDDLTTWGGNNYSAAPEELEYVQYGDYPQTIKADDVYVFDTNATIVRGSSWGTETMYLGSDGCYYVSSEVNLFDTGANYGSLLTAIPKGESRYFKVEPIVWRVLGDYDSDRDGSTDGVLLVTDKALDRIFFYEDEVDPYDTDDVIRMTAGTKSRSYANWYNYKYSTIRAFLNGKYESDDNEKASPLSGEDYEGNGFLQRAFVSNESGVIKPVTVSNKFETATPTGGSFESKIETEIKKMICDDTEDSVFLMSVSEWTDTTYKFKGGTGTGEALMHTLRYRKPTEYALARGAKIGGKFSGEFWMRSPLVTVNSKDPTKLDYKASYMSYDGKVQGSGSVRGAYPAGSVVPSICVDATVVQDALNPAP